MKKSRLIEILSELSDDTEIFIDTIDLTPVAPFLDIVGLDPDGVGRNRRILNIEELKIDEDINPICEACGQPT